MNPGWYADPFRAEHIRYWDGESWVGSSVPMPSAPPAPSGMKYELPPPTELSAEASIEETSEIPSQGPIVEPTSVEEPATTQPEAPRLEAEATVIQPNVIADLGLPATDHVARVSRTPSGGSPARPTRSSSKLWFFAVGALVALSAILIATTQMKQAATTPNGIIEASAAEAVVTSTIHRSMLANPSNKLFGPPADWFIADRPYMTLTVYHSVADLNVDKPSIEQLEDAVYVGYCANVGLVSEEKAQFDQALQAIVTNFNCTPTSFVNSPGPKPPASPEVNASNAPNPMPTVSESTSQLQPSSVAVPWVGLGSSGSTTIHFDLTDCEHCHIEYGNARHQDAVELPYKWTNNAHTNLSLPTNETAGLYFTISSDDKTKCPYGCAFEDQATAAVVLGYDDIETGSSVTSSTALHMKTRNICFAGTDATQMTIHVHARLVPGVSAVSETGRTYNVAAWASPTIATLASHKWPLVHGVAVGGQDNLAVESC